jgi:hypothetical protein
MAPEKGCCPENRAVSPDEEPHFIESFKRLDLKKPRK